MNNTNSLRMEYYGHNNKNDSYDNLKGLNKEVES